MLQLLLFSCSQVTTIPPVQIPVAPIVRRLACGQDSLQITDFVQHLVPDPVLRKRMLSFYRNRNYVPAWIDDSGLNENADNLINFLDNERSYSFRKPGQLRGELHELQQKILADTSGRIYCGDSLALQFEVLLTKSFFEFAERNWGGAEDRILQQVDWYIVRKQLNYDQLLNNYLHSGKETLIEEPVYRQYSLLKNYLRRYSKMALEGGWPLLPGKDETLKPGDSSATVIALKKLLFITGDISVADSTVIFDTLLENAVKKFQKRHGLKADGIVSKKTLQAMRVPVKERVRQILINMERCRWVPVQVSGKYLVVNIPGFSLHVYNNGKQQWSCKVIVGESEKLHHTVIFNDSVAFVVFNPYWNIPKNILKRETLPAIKRDVRYLSRNDLEVVDANGRVIDPSGISWQNYTSHFPYLIRQKPGKNNALGSLKFLFPNRYDIYMHDTPSRKLFDEPDRDFSHGCIRVEQPLRLAEFLLSEDTTWTPEKITALLSEGKETFVKLKKKVPVFIAYFTCWVDGDGKLNFRNDIYGHDAKLKTLLFVN